MTYQPSKFFVAVLAAAVCAGQALAQTNVVPAGTKSADKMTELFGDPVVARGKGFEIKRSLLDSMMVGIRTTWAARGRPIPPDAEPAMERQVLEQLIQIDIMLLKANDADRAKGKELAEKTLADNLKRAGSQEAYVRQLKSVGLTPDDLRNRTVEAAIAQVVAEREMHVSVTDADAKKYYEDHPSQFEVPENVRVAHILLATRDQNTGEPLTDAQKEAKHKKLEAILKRARAGEDFSKLAKENSEDTQVMDTGGELPAFPRDAMPNTPEFEAAAFSLGTNQVSDIVTTQFGYHIIKLLEKVPAKKIAYDKIAEDLKDNLKQRQMVKLLPEYGEKLKKEGQVEILDEKLKAIDLPTPAARGTSADKTSP